MYSQLKYQKSGKLYYVPTPLDEISLFIGMNLLTSIKKQCSCHDYWSSALDLHDTYISSLMPVNRFSLNYLIYMLTTIYLCQKGVKLITINYLK